MNEGRQEKEYDVHRSKCKYPEKTAAATSLFQPRRKESLGCVQRRFHICRLRK